MQNKGNYAAVQSIQELKEFIDAAIAAGTVAFDCETDGLNTITCKIQGFSLCHKKGSADGV